MNRAKTSIVLVFVAAMQSNATSAAESVMQPGAWETRQTTFMFDPQSGKDQPILPPFPKVECLSASFLLSDPYMNPDRDKKEQEQRDTKCTVSDQKRVGNTASWTLVCGLPGGAKLEVATVNSVSRDAFSLVSHFKSEGTQARTETTSKRIGECAKIRQ